MSNLSYCRFQNTLEDLRDCEENIDMRNLSYDENIARIDLIKICKDIARHYEDIYKCELSKHFEDNEEDNGEDE